MRRLILTAILPGFTFACCAHPEPDFPLNRQEFVDNGIEKCSLRHLENQIFGVDLSDYDIRVSFLGFVSSAHEKFGVLFHDAVRIQNYRGTRRVIIMKSGCNYVGHYVVPADPLRVSGPDIWFDAPAEYGNVIHFSSNAPPKQAWIDGEVNNFAR